MNDNALRQPNENCRIHPSQSHDWNGREWICGHCFLGYEPESTYGKMLQIVKEALQSHEETIYRGESYRLNTYAEKATDKIMDALNDHNTQLLLQQNDSIPMRGPSFG